jgi:tetratricopeptide (TPR) repeat protein
MTVYKAEEKVRLRKEREREAINYAMASQWQKAAEANQAILALFPNDVEAYNRLGKAYMELGQYQKARDAFSRALALSASNEIAKRNLARLDFLSPHKIVPKPRKEERRADPRLFIEETGKTGVIELRDVADAKLLARMTPGDVVNLKMEQKELLVTTLDGQYLGKVDTGIGLRLMKLMQGGNRYAAAITSVTPRQLKVIIKEVYQHPSQIGRVSFPSSRASLEGWSPYLRESLLKSYSLPLEEEEDYAPPGGEGGWEGEEEEGEELVSRERGPQEDAVEEEEEEEE